SAGRRGRRELAGAAESRGGGARGPPPRDLPHDTPALRASADEADRVASARALGPRHPLAVREGRPAEHRPGAIAWPASTDEVALLVRWARRRGVALAPFGAGSGVCAGILPREGLVVVDLKRMARIRRLEAGAPPGAGAARG